MIIYLVFVPAKLELFLVKNDDSLSNNSDLNLFISSSILFISRSNRSRMESNSVSRTEKSFILMGTLLFFSAILLTWYYSSSKVVMFWTQVHNWACTTFLQYLKSKGDFFSIDCCCMQQLLLHCFASYIGDLQSHQSKTIKFSFFIGLVSDLIQHQKFLLKKDLLLRFWTCLFRQLKMF